MKRIILIALLICAGMVSAQTRTTVSIPSIGTAKFDAYRYSPGVPVKGKSPVIIAYPGTGETSLSSADSRGLPGAIKAGLKIPFTVITIPFNSSWYDTARYTKKILDWIWKQPDLDTNRVYMTGLSAGANGTYQYLLAKDDRVAAYAPISVNTQVFMDRKYFRAPRAWKKRPVRSFHGAKDTSPNELSSTRAFLAEYNRILPGLMTQTVFTNLGHNAWDAVYTSKFTEPHTGEPFKISIYDWFLKYTLWPENPIPPVEPPVDPCADQKCVVHVIGIFVDPATGEVNFMSEDGKRRFITKVQEVKP
jgi:hypothetical protein